jgi:hypothetical protein
VAVRPPEARGKVWGGVGQSEIGSVDVGLLDDQVPGLSVAPKASGDFRGARGASRDHDGDHVRWTGYGPAAGVSQYVAIPHADAEPADSVEDEPGRMAGCRRHGRTRRRLHAAIGQMQDCRGSNANAVSRHWQLASTLHRRLRASAASGTRDRYRRGRSVGQRLCLGLRRGRQKKQTHLQDTDHRAAELAGGSDANPTDEQQRDRGDDANNDSMSHGWLSIPTRWAGRKPGLRASRQLWCRVRTPARPASRAHESAPAPAQENATRRATHLSESRHLPAATAQATEEAR